MRVTTIISWTTENAKAINARFGDFKSGNVPDEVKQAFGRLNIVAWEKLTTNRVLTIAEGDEIDIAVWNGYWQDLADFELTEPSYNMKDDEVLGKIFPPAYMQM